MIWNSHIFTRICRGSRLLICCSILNKANLYTSKRFLMLACLLLTFLLTPLLLLSVHATLIDWKRAQTFSTCHCWLGVWECQPPFTARAQRSVEDPILFTLIAWFCCRFPAGEKETLCRGLPRGKWKYHYVHGRTLKLHLLIAWTLAHTSVNSKATPPRLCSRLHARHSQLATRSLGCSTRSLEWNRFRVGIQEMERGGGTYSVVGQL